jgi:serine/threonine-protein kinase
VKKDGRLVPGQMFGRYQIVRVLGEGGMGVVYEAIHPTLKKRFAVKTLLPSVAELPTVHARFLREGEATARIHHPHIVDIMDVGEEDGMPFLVMEFLEGQTLAELLASRSGLAVAEAVDLVLPVLSAVAAGHAQGVVHRDLKPANIFLSRGPWGEPFPKVLDFGISKLIGDTNGAALTGTLTVLGTAAYMSPEQTRGVREIDGRSDQYSLGLILYEAVTGRRAHDGDHALEVLHNIANGIFKPARQVRGDLPAAFDGILLRMLSLEAGARYRSLLEVGRALLPFASEKARITLADAFPPEKTGGDARAAVLATPARPASPRPVEPTTFRHSAAEMNASGPSRRSGRAPVVALAVVALIAVGGWMFTHRSAPTVAPVPSVAPAPSAAAGAPTVATPPPAPPTTPTPPEEKPAPPPTPAPPAAAAAAPTVAADLKPAHHAHHKKPASRADPATTPAHTADDAPKRGANNALIIK